MNKTYRFTIHHQPFNLVLTPSQSRGYCHCCHLEKEIRVISEKLLGTSVGEERKFCGSCALINLAELTESDYECEKKTNLN